MWVSVLGSNRCAEWDSFAAGQPAFALLQSCAWAEFKERLGWQTIRVAVEDNSGIVAGAQMLVKPLAFGLGAVAYVPRGPLGEWLDSEVMSLLVSGVHDQARRHRALFLKIEPPAADSGAVTESLLRHGFRRSRHTNQPRATIILDISRDPSDILKDMRKKTRQYVSASMREGITVREGTLEDLPAFVRIMRETAAREGFPARGHSYYAGELETLLPAGLVRLLMAFHGEELLAVRSVCRFGAHAAEFHGGSTGRNHLHPNYALVWAAIQWAKEHGCRTYDLWGVPDEVGDAVARGSEAPVEERTDGLWGVYRFKRGFGTNVVCYVGAFDYVYFPAAYALITGSFSNLERAATLMDRTFRPKVAAP